MGVFSPAEFEGLIISSQLYKVSLQLISFHIIFSINSNHEKHLNQPILNLNSLLKVNSLHRYYGVSTLLTHTIPIPSDMANNFYANSHKTASQWNPGFMGSVKPILFFSSADPLVALNFQTPGVEMDLNDGRFLANGCCGYVLKPSFLRNSQSTFDPEAPGRRTGQRPVALTVKVQ